MRKSILTLLAAGLVALPGGLSAQAFGVAARVGSLGAGAEAALGLGLGSRVVLRGGLGFLPLEPDVTIDDIDFTLKFPDSWYNLGADLYLTGSFRVGGGILFKSDDPSVEGVLNSNVDIGGRDFTPQEIGTLTGVFDSRDSAPYLILGFGKHTASGVGLFVDMGAAFLGEPTVQLDARGGTFSDEAELRQRLDVEERNLEDDAGSYLKLWPILNVGLRIGLGG